LRHETPDRDLAERLTVFCAAFHFWHGEAARAAAILHTLPVESPNDLTAIAARLVGAMVPSDHPRFLVPETQTQPATRPVVLDSRACRLLDIFTGEPVLRAALSAAGIPAVIPDETQRQDTRPFGSTLVSRRIAELVGRGAYLEAARVQDLAIEMERQALGALNLARSIARSGQLHALAQDFRAALEALDDALTRCRDMGCDMLAWHVQLWRAHCMLGLGEQHAADEALSEALRRSAASGVIEGHPWWQPARSGLLAARALALGIEREYVFRWIRMRDLPPPSADIDDWPWPLRIYTLGRFSIVADGSALAFQGKSQKKPLDLLKAAIAMGGSEIAITLLMEALWPDADTDAARKAFDVALLRLRRLLGRDDAIAIADGRLSVNAKVCWVDLVSLERLASTVDRMTDTAQRHRATLEVLSRYRGAFLQLDEPQPWMAATRERIAGKVRRLVLGAGRALEEAQRLPEAIDLYERAIEVQPCAEPLYRQLMSCLAATGAHAEAREVYQRCRSMLGAMSGTTPSRDTEDVLASLRG
jgi:DNA-binding SARP family transcriptional activator